MKKLIIPAFLLLHLISEAQFLEFGSGVAGLNYSGDLMRGYHITNIKPGIGFQHRMNFTEYVTIRWELIIGKLSGSDKDPIDAFAQERKAAFDITIGELSSVIEYHFLDYKHQKSVVRWSPYAFTGISFFRMSGVGQKNDDYNMIQPSIPFGFGFKHLIGKRFSVGAEFGVRMTFFDYLDNISNGDLAIKDYQYGNEFDNDMYTSFGISLSYILWEIPCPFPYVPNKSILRR